MPQDPVGIGCWYPIPGRRDACFSLCPEGKFNPLSAGESACAEHAAGTLSLVWEILSFLHFLFYFISCSMILPRCPQGPPSLPFATSTISKARKKTAQRHTGCQPFSGNVFMLLSSTVPDSSRLFQTKVYSTIEATLCCAISLCRAHFSSQGIAKPQYVATWVGVPKESQLHPRIVVPFFFFSFLVDIRMLWPCSGSEHCLWHVLRSTRVNDVIKSLGKF